MSLSQRRRRPVFRGSPEALEPRSLMAGTVSGAWPGPHNLELTLENGTLQSGLVLTVNAAQLAAGGGSAVFSGTIIGPTPDFHAGEAELRFRVDPPTGFQRVVTDFSGTVPSPFPNRGQVTFSGATLPLTANRSNPIRVSAVRPGFPTAFPFAGDLQIVVDTIAPTVTSVGPVEPNPRGIGVETVDVQLSESVQLTTFTRDDLNLTRDGSTVALTAGVNVVELANTPGRYRIEGLTDLTDEAGIYELTVTAAGTLDAAGNAGAGSNATSFTVDPTINLPPAPPPPDLRPLSDTGLSDSDDVTNTANPRFAVTGVEADERVQLLRDGQVIAERIGPGPVTDPGVARSGTFAYTLRRVGSGDVVGLPSTALTVVIDLSRPMLALDVGAEGRTFTSAGGAATTSRRPTIEITPSDLPSFPSNVVVVSLEAVDGRPLGPAIVAPPATPGTTVRLTLPTDLDPGTHTALVRGVDRAGNLVEATLSFVVLADPPLTAPGTPVFSTVYDLRGLLTGTSAVERPWSMAFDRTTQTIWAVVRGEDINPANTTGNRLIQFDPATGGVRSFDLQGMAPDRDPNSGPHGVFFDFETHLTPRVWFTQRTGPNAGRLSYLDLANDRLVTYDLRGLLLANGVPGAGADVHAVTVDRRGTVWVSDEADNLLIELDFDGGEAGLASTRGVATIHRLPPQMFELPGLIQEEEAGPHGIDTVVDDRTGETFVYFTAIGRGRFGLLRPGRDGRDDLYASWDVSEALANEGIIGGAPQFPTIDNGETPGRPEDDRVYFGDPGFPRSTINRPNNVIRELRPGNYVLDAGAISSPVRTWRVPQTSGASEGAAFAQPNQVFVDREGTVFYLDRRSGFGRIDPIEAGGAIDARIERATMRPSPPIALAPIRVIDGATARLNPTGLVIAPVGSNASGLVAPEDRSNLGGLDQYLVRGPDTGGANRGAGPFRGTFSAGNIAYGSLTMSDQIAGTIFAETSRREMSVIFDTAGTRRAFQVLRDGRLILTERPAGALVDRQTDLSAAPDTARFVGDVSTVLDARGVLHVFGRDRRGGLSEYFLAPGAGGWQSRRVADIGRPLSHPEAFLDPVLGAAAAVTDDRGHLIVITADGGVTDLTEQVGGGTTWVVYSKVAAVEAEGRTFFYGTNQRGGMVEYEVAAGFGSATPRWVVDPEGPRLTSVFQDVEAVAVGSTRHVFASDGSSRLVHVEVRPDGISIENVTELVRATATGYAPFQQPFAARVYAGSDVSVGPDGTLFVHGTNGRDLVEFERTPAGRWTAANLTNRPANRVFGNPSGYVLPNGDRHVLMINEDGDVVEYYKLAGLEFATYNITLAQGNTSLVVPPTYTNELPGTPAPSVTTFSFGRAGASVSGRIAETGGVEVVRFVAPRSGRVVFTLASRDRRLRLGDGRRGGRRLVIDVVEGQSYDLTISGRGRGGYAVMARFARVASRPRFPGRPR